ncbi:MAG: SEC-C domain-containing protein [Acidobacteria bacterium]|nr:SEC-C domain-containing protein [Acidobacteriota bacterium]
MHPLNAKQLEAIQALSSGLTATAAADAIGVHRTTLHNWCRTIPDFSDTLEASKRAYIDKYRSAMNSLADPSINILRNILDDDSASPSLRLRTALAIIKFVTTAEKSSTPKQQQSTDQLLDAAYMAGYRAAQDEIHHNSSLSSPVETDESDESIESTEPAESAESHDTPQTHQTPRNALCPCGSGAKYKRCCGKNAPPVLSRSKSQTKEARS